MTTKVGMRLSVTFSCIVVLSYFWISLMWSAPVTLQFILNVDTLTKSRVDAEEERLEREAERANQEHRPLELSRRRQLPQGNDENQNLNEMLSHYEEDCMIPLEIYRSEE